jgi:phosphoglycolate phosphatase
MMAGISARRQQHPGFPRYRVLLLDWDGTIADSRDAILASFAATFAHFGEPVPPQSVIEATIGMQLTEAMVRLCPRAAGHEQEWLSVYREHSVRQEQARTRLFEGVAEVLEAAGRQGLCVGVVSNKSQSGLKAAVQRCGLTGQIAFAAGTLAGEPRKPDAGMFHRQVRPCLPAVDPAEILMIGDTAIDLLFARNAGLAACWAAYGYGEAAACRALQPQHSVQHPRELLSLLVPASRQDSSETMA